MAWGRAPPPRCCCRIPRSALRSCPPQPITLPGIATDVIAGDASGDGRTDLAFWVITSSADFIATTAMATMRQAGSGTLAAPELALRYTGLNVERMAFTDYERDGLLDVFAFLTPQSTDYKPRLVLARQQPPGVYTGIETSLAGVQGIDDAVIADLDGDGRPDVAVVGYWPDQGNTRGRVTLFAPSGGGSFMQRAQYDASDSASRIAAADLDGDGLNDLVILAGRDQCYVMIQARATPGSFAAPRPLR